MFLFQEYLEISGEPRTSVLINRQHFRKLVAPQTFSASRHYYRYLRLSDSSTIAPFKIRTFPIKVNPLQGTVSSEKPFRAISHHSLTIYIYSAYTHPRCNVGNTYIFRRLEFFRFSHFGISGIQWDEIKFSVLLEPFDVKCIGIRRWIVYLEVPFLNEPIFRWLIHRM